MKALFDLEKINELKKEYLKFECKSCLCIFLGDKRAVKRSLGLIKGDGKNKIDYCSNNLSMSLSFLKDFQVTTPVLLSEIYSTSSSNSIVLSKYFSNTGLTRGKLTDSLIKKSMYSFS